MLANQVNNFQIVRLLAEGGMGRVYAAEHGLIGKQVVVKVLRAEMASDPNLVNRFFNEARVMTGLRHPNMVELIDYGHLPNGLPYLVMELLDGENLSDRLERVKSIRELAGALAPLRPLLAAVHAPLVPPGPDSADAVRPVSTRLKKENDVVASEATAPLSARPVDRSSNRTELGRLALRRGSRDCDGDLKTNKLSGISDDLVVLSNPQNTSFGKAETQV